METQITHFLASNYDDKKGFLPLDTDTYETKELQIYGYEIMIYIELGIELKVSNGSSLQQKFNMNS